MKTPDPRTGPDTPTLPVLVVDDDRMVRSLVRMALETQGFSIKETSDGQEALAQIDEGAPFSAILLDHHMPGMEGYAVLREIKTRMPKVPVVMMTADNSQKLAIQCFREGADDFIAKPFDSDLLPIVISRAMKKADLEKKLKEKTLAHLSAQKSTEIQSLFLKNIQQEVVRPISDIQKKIHEFMHAGKEGSRKADAVCREINDRSEDLMRTLQGILDLATLETSKVTPNLAETVVFDILKTAAATLKSIADKKNVSIIHETSIPEDMRLLCDMHWTRKALEALIHNAIFHSDDYSSISLKAAHNEEGLVLSVINTGDPIPKYDMERIFEPFQKGRNARPSQHGTGIGLAMAKRALELQGAHLTVENMIELRQVAFHIAFPVKK